MYGKAKNGAFKAYFDQKVVSITPGTAMKKIKNSFHLKKPKTKIKKAWGCVCNYKTAT